MTCVETRALRAQEMEGISTPLSAAPCAPRKMGFSSYARAKAQYCGFFGPLCPQTPKKRRRNDSKGSKKYRYKGQCRSGAMQCNATQGHSGASVKSGGVQQKAEGHFISLSTVSLSALMAACSFRVCRIASSLYEDCQWLLLLLQCFRGSSKHTEQTATP